MHPYKAPRTFSFAEAKQTYRHFKRRSHFGKVVITVSPPTSKVTVEIEVRQLSALAVAGFHAVAPDMRGYGQTDAPQEIDRYTVLHAIGDMVGLLDALGIAQAVIAGHDWGATVAWLAAQLRPDRFPAVIALSVPYRARGAVRPTSVMPQTDEAIWYQLYFQEPGVAEAEYDRNVRPVFHAGRIGISGDAPPGTRPFGMVPRRGSPFRWNVEPPPLPAWLSEADIDFYVAEFTRTGFRGGRNIEAVARSSWTGLRPDTVCRSPYSDEVRTSSQGSRSGPAGRSSARSWPR